MDQTKPTAKGFTVKLGHPVLIFFWSAWMLLLGMARHALASIACYCGLRIRNMRGHDCRSRDGRRICLVHADSLVTWEMPRPEPSLSRMEPKHSNQPSTLQNLPAASGLALSLV